MKRRISRSSGFTLIELCVVLAMVAILLALATSAYQEQIRTAQRSEAFSLLAKVAAAQERYLYVHGRYAAQIEGEIGNNPATSGLGLPVSTQENAMDTAYYELTLTLQDDGLSYTIEAQPRGSRQEVDRCGVLRQHSSGERGAQGSNCIR